MKTEKDKVGCYWNSSWRYFERKVGTLSYQEHPYPRTWERCRQAGASSGKMMYWRLFSCVAVVVRITSFVFDDQPHKSIVSSQEVTESGRRLCCCAFETRIVLSATWKKINNLVDFILSEQCRLTFLQVATWSPGRVLLGVGVTILHHRRLFFILVVFIVLRRRRGRCRLLEHRLLGRWRWGRHVWDYK